jgi:hypothetical protein
MKILCFIISFDFDYSNRTKKQLLWRNRNQIYKIRVSTKTFNCLDNKSTIEIGSNDEDEDIMVKYLLLYL